MSGREDVAMECQHAPVPQLDRTMLRFCSAVQLGPFAASHERTIEQCSPSCGTTASAQQYGCPSFGTGRVLGIPSLRRTNASVIP